uniref:hypothetical protein n=1 Tax=Nocardia cyriacigeorgica TaxID=135487 RepID=UPI0024564767
DDAADSPADAWAVAPGAAGAPRAGEPPPPPPPGAPPPPGPPRWMLLSPGMAPAAEIATGVRGTNSALAVDGVNTVP